MTTKDLKNAMQRLLENLISRILNRKNTDAINTLMSFTLGTLEYCLHQDAFEEIRPKTAKLAISQATINVQKNFWRGYASDEKKYIYTNTLDSTEPITLNLETAATNCGKVLKIINRTENARFLGDEAFRKSEHISYVFNEYTSIYLAENLPTPRATPPASLESNSQRRSRPRNDA